MSGSSVITYIERVIEENCGEALELDEQQATELARAVSEYVEMNRDSGAFVDSGYLVMLASRALASVGQERAAHRLLVFGSGLVRPSEWEFTGGCDVWTLDLRQMTVRDSEPLELVFFSSLNIVLASIADVWEQSGGSGFLGLRHVCDTASALLGGRKKGVDGLAGEIRSHCSAKLEQLGRERGWQDIPQIVNID